MSVSLRKHRQGFTLVELLVVIAIIGVLVGMLLPAVQAVREAARRATCLNNMRQVVLACHNYQSSNLKFPPGASTLGGEGFLVYLLPFMDQGPLSDDYKAGSIATIADLCDNRIPMFLCASATQSDELTTDSSLGEVTSHYFGSSGSAVNMSGVYNRYSTWGGEPVGIDGVFSPFLGASTWPSSAAFVYSQKRAKNFDDMRDGSSNCVAIGEMSRSENPNTGFAPQRPGWACGTSGGGSGDELTFSTNTFAFDFSGSPDSMVNGMNTEFNTHSFASNHPGGSQFAMADGSARFVPEGVSETVLAATMSIRDGVTTSFDD